MESDSELRIDGLEKALASLATLGQAIDSLGEAARRAVPAFTLASPAEIGSMAPGDSGGLQGGGADVFSPLSTQLTQALSAVLVPELQNLSARLSETLSSLRVPVLENATAALTQTTAGLNPVIAALNDSVGALTRTVQGFSVQPAQVFGISPEQLQMHLGALSDNKGPFLRTAGNLGEAGMQAGLSALLSGKPVVGGVAAILGAGISYAADAAGRNQYFGYDEDAEERLNFVRGFQDISSIEDGWILDKGMKQDSQRRGFMAQVEFFSGKLQELNDAANQDVAPMLDEPRELFQREQAKALRELYARMLLELLDRAKSAGGVGQEAFDPEVLNLARQYGTEASDNITPAMGAVTQSSVMRMEPIDIRVKLFSDCKTIVHSVNPNPNVDVSIDLSCGLNGVWYGIPR